MDHATSEDSSHDISASAKTMAVNRPASATSTVKMDVSDDMEPANFPLPASPAPETATPTELDPANYPLPESPMPRGIDYLGIAIASPDSSCSLIRSAPSTRANSGEDDFEAASLLLEGTESAEEAFTESPDSTGSLTPKQTASTGTVSNVLASTISLDCESPPLGTSAGPEPTSCELVQTDSESSEAELTGTAASAEFQHPETASVYRIMCDLLWSILAFFGLVVPNPPIASPTPSKLAAPTEYVDEIYTLIGLPDESSSVDSTIPDPSSAVATLPSAHFVRDAEGFVHRFEGGIQTFSSKCITQKAELPDGLTLNEVLDTYKAILIDFKESSSCAELKKFLEGTLLKLPKLQLSSCIATGLGTFTASHPYCNENPEISLLQLAALEYMIEVLRRKFTIDTAYIQDPAMNALDEQLVTLLGYTVLHDPEAMNAMTPTTFLYAPKNEFLVLGDLFFVAFPALYLGNNLAIYHQNLLFIPHHVREEYASQGISKDTLNNYLAQDKKLWNEPEGKNITRKQLIDTYMPYNLQKSEEILIAYEHGRKSWSWKPWGTQMIYWAED